MSARSKDKPPVSWETIQRVADRAGEEKLEARGIDELDRELREAGLEEDAADDLLERALAADAASRGAGGAEAGGKPRTPAPPPRHAGASPRGRGSSATVALLAAAAVLLLVLAWKHRELEAWLQPSPEPIEPDRPGPAHRLTARERATALRDKAFAACGGAQWTPCQQQLDEAKELDPAGEYDPRVQSAREQIEGSLHLDGGTPDDKERKTLDDKDGKRGGQRAP